MRGEGEIGKKISRLTQLQNPALSMASRVFLPHLLIVVFYHIPVNVIWARCLFYVVWFLIATIRVTGMWYMIKSTSSHSQGWRLAWSNEGHRLRSEVLDPEGASWNIRISFACGEGPWLRSQTSHLRTGLWTQISWLSSRHAFPLSIDWLIRESLAPWRLIWEFLGSHGILAPSGVFLLPQTLCLLFPSVLGYPWIARASSPWFAHGREYREQITLFSFDNSLQI